MSDAANSASFHNAPPFVVSYRVVNVLLRVSGMATPTFVLGNDTNPAYLERNE